MGPGVSNATAKEALAPVERVAASFFVEEHAATIPTAMWKMPTRRRGETLDI
jgi:hypothetical protein